MADDTTPDDQTTPTPRSRRRRAVAPAGTPVNPVATEPAADGAAGTEPATDAAADPGPVAVPDPADVVREAMAELRPEAEPEEDATAAGDGASRPMTVLFQAPAETASTRSRRAVASAGPAQPALFAPPAARGSGESDEEPGTDPASAGADPDQEPRSRPTRRRRRAAATTAPEGDEALAGPVTDEGDAARGGGDAPDVDEADVPDVDGVGEEVGDVADDTVEDDDDDEDEDDDAGEDDDEDDNAGEDDAADDAEGGSTTRRRRRRVGRG
ncbi:MAG: hypothetical protein ACFCVG_17265, partial [Kineosporiaceae bacterium]